MADTTEEGCPWYETQMDRLFEDPEARLADIQQLARIASTYRRCRSAVALAIVTTGQRFSSRVHSGRRVVRADYPAGCLGLRRGLPNRGFMVGRWLSTGSVGRDRIGGPTAASRFLRYGQGLPGKTQGRPHPH